MKQHTLFNRKIFAATAVSAIFMLTACANVTQQKTAFDEIQTEFDVINDNSTAQKLIPVAIYDAKKAVATAKKAIETKESVGVQNHLLFVADKKIKLATIALDTKLVELDHDALVKERESALLAAKVMELSQVRGEARSARLDAISKTEELKKAQAAISEKDVRIAANDADKSAAEKKLKALESRMVGLETQRTSRGLVATLGGVLFDSGKAVLHAGVARNLDPIVDAMKADLSLMIAIEGHTDSRGSDALNQTLSINRAAAVKNMLVSKGIDPARITSDGFGSAYPMATNETEAGRQRNRRVEVLFKN